VVRLSSVVAVETSAPDSQDTFAPRANGAGPGVGATRRPCGREPYNCRSRSMPHGRAGAAGRTIG
jgi:hypothetical protein